MKRFFTASLLIALCTFTFTCADKKQQSADKYLFEQSAAEQSESIGRYTAGCIRNPEKLPLYGPGYQVIRLHRGRYFGHSQTVNLIRNLGYRLDSKYDTTLYIADISKKGGGPILDDHSSHQTGLDADILFIHKPARKNNFLPADIREDTHPESVLDNGGTRVDDNKWSPVNEKILMQVAGDKNVDRIFVNPAIKRKLCGKYTEGEWLRKIRPWWGHDGHFHVRLKCPDNSPDCVSGPDIPPGTGCGQDLAWWFSEDARIKRREARKVPPRTEDDIDLPAECYKILYGKSEM